MIQARKNEKGSSFIEVLIAIIILGLVAAFGITAMSTAVKSHFTVEVTANAKGLAEQQMDQIKSQPFTSSYVAITDLPPNYTIDPILVESVPTRDNATMQKITVIVRYNDDQVGKLEDYKVRR